MDELEKFITDAGCAGADRLQISYGGKSVEVNALRLWRALAIAKIRRTDHDRSQAILAIAREYDTPTEAAISICSVVAAVASLSQPKDERQQTELLCQLLREQINSCRAHVKRAR